MRRTVVGLQCFALTFQVSMLISNSRLVPKSVKRALVKLRKFVVGKWIAGLNSGPKSTHRSFRRRLDHTQKLEAGVDVNVAVFCWETNETLADAIASVHKGRQLTLALRQGAKTNGLGGLSKQQVWIDSYQKVLFCSYPKCTQDVNQTENSPLCCSFTQQSWLANKKTAQSFCCADSWRQLGCVHTSSQSVVWLLAMACDIGGRRLPFHDGANRRHRYLLWTIFWKFKAVTHHHIGPLHWQIHRTWQQ